MAIAGIVPGVANIAFFLSYFETRAAKIFIYSHGFFGIVIWLLLLLLRGNARQRLPRRIGGGRASSKPPSLGPRSDPCLY